MLELFIEEDVHRRLVLKRDGQITECYIEDRENPARSGDIFLGIIKKKVKALNSVFVDIGLGKNAYLYVTDKGRFEDYREGQSLLVEVLKEEEGSKGAKVTEKVSLGGKYVVLFPGKGFSFSKKIQREAFLERHGSQKPLAGYQVLFREASFLADQGLVREEMETLKTEFDLIFQRAETGVGPRRLYGEISFLDRILRDRFQELKMIYADSTETVQYLKLNYGLPALVSPDGRRLFDFYGIEAELQKLRDPKVRLKNGGNLVIEQTEAMVVIDINSAKYTGKGDKESTAFHMNLQAVEEIARQIRLRNLSGIILIDFIDMQRPENRAALQKAVDKAFAEDPLFSKSYPLTDLNLMQLTRKKKGYPLRHYLEEPCRHCHGTGQILLYAYLLKQVAGEIGRHVDNVEILDYHVELDEIYRSDVELDLGAFLQAIGGENKRIYLQYTRGKGPYRVQPLVFKNQIAELEEFLLKS